MFNSHINHVLIQVFLAIHIGVSHSTQLCGHTTYMQIEQHLAEILPPVLLLSANCGSCVVEEFHGSQMEVLTGTYMFLKCFNTVTKSYLCMSRPAGQRLVELFQCDPVQAFFSGVSPKGLHPEKAIYQPSVLRKVHCKVISVQLTVNTITFFYITAPGEIQTWMCTCPTGQWQPCGVAYPALQFAI